MRPASASWGPASFVWNIPPSKPLKTAPAFSRCSATPRPQSFKQWREADAWHLETTELHLRYRADGLPFHAGNLSIEVKVAPGAHWHPGMASLGNLGGTLRTLDNCEGPQSLGEGLLSRDGWYLRDDSATVLYDGGAEPWVAPRPPEAWIGISSATAVTTPRPCAP